MPRSNQIASSTSNLDPRLRLLPNLQNNPVHEERGFAHIIIAECRATSPDVATPTSRCKSLPPLTYPTPRSESINQRQRRGRDELQYSDAFRKRVASGMPPSLVRDGLGFHPWKAALERRPQQRKRRPRASSSPRLPPKMYPCTSSGQDPES